MLLGIDGYLNPQHPLAHDALSEEDDEQAPGTSFLAHKRLNTPMALNARNKRTSNDIIYSDDEDTTPTRNSRKQGHTLTATARKVSRSIVFASRFVVAHFVDKKVMFYATPRDYAKTFGLLAALAMTIGGVFSIAHAVRSSPFRFPDFLLGLYSIVSGALLFKHDDVTARTRTVPGSGYTSCYFRMLITVPLILSWYTIGGMVCGMLSAFMHFYVAHEDRASDAYEEIAPFSDVEQNASWRYADGSPVSKWSGESGCVAIQPFSQRAATRSPRTENLANYQTHSGGTCSLCERTVAGKVKRVSSPWQ